MLFNNQYLNKNQWIKKRNENIVIFIRLRGVSSKIRLWLKRCNYNMFHYFKFSLFVLTVKSK